MDSFLLAAVYLTAGAAEYRKAFPESQYIQFNDADDARRAMKNDAAPSDNQRLSLYAYLYLYVKLAKKDDAILEQLQQLLKLSPAVCEKPNLFITVERLSYIDKLYQENGYSYLRIFQVPEQFIQDLILEITVAEVHEPKKHLRGLQSREYEHPLDKEALEKLKKTPGLDIIKDKYREFHLDSFYVNEFLGSCFFATESNFPDLCQALAEVCAVLDEHPIPELYLSSGWINAFAIGCEKPIIVLSSAVLSLFDYDELLWLLGHEVGHIKSQHMFYHQLCNFLPILGDMASTATFGIAGFISKPIEWALLGWHRQSELSADRAGLLACQNPDAVYSALTKMAGYPPRCYGRLDTADILRQARTFEERNIKATDKVANFLDILGSTHPRTILRAKEIDKWVTTGGYDKVMNEKAGRLPPTYRSDSGRSIPKDKITISFSQNKDKDGQ